MASGFLRQPIFMDGIFSKLASFNSLVVTSVAYIFCVTFLASPHAGSGVVEPVSWIFSDFQAYGPRDASEQNQHDTRSTYTTCKYSVNITSTSENHHESEFQNVLVNDIINWQNMIAEYGHFFCVVDLICRFIACSWLKQKQSQLKDQITSHTVAVLSNVYL